MSDEITFQFVYCFYSFCLCLKKVRVKLKVKQMAWKIVCKFSELCYDDPLPPYTYTPCHQ